MAQEPEGEISCCGPVSWDVTDPTQQEVSIILRNMKLDPTFQGVFSLGKDGVMRSLTADRDVVDAMGLNPQQIAAFLVRVGPEPGDECDFKDADGTKVPKEQWFHPDKALLPEPLSQEHRDKFKKELEEDPDLPKRLREQAKLRGAKLA